MPCAKALRWNRMILKEGHWKEQRRAYAWRVCLELAGPCWAWKVLVFILKGCEQGFMGQAANSPSTPVCYNNEVDTNRGDARCHFPASHWGDFNKLYRLHLAYELNLLSLLRRCKFLWEKWFAYLKKGNSHTHWMNKCHDLYLCQVPPQALEMRSWKRKTGF